MAPARRGAGNLPAELTSFVGRRGEIAEVRRVLAESRLVTLTGVGGVGKTRLALRAAAGLRVLATSRESLNTAAETALPVLPLAAPDPGQPLTLAQLGAFPAVALFAERAAQVMPGFAVTEANMAAVPGSAAGWRGCRWPSSWRPRGPGCCPQSRSTPGWAC